MAPRAQDAADHLLRAATTWPGHLIGQVHRRHLVGLVAPGYAPENTVAVGDMISRKAHEGTSLEAIRDVAAVDTAFVRAHGGAPLIIRLPDDSGKAGIDLRTKFVAHLAGYDVRLHPRSGRKFMRARPVAAQAEYGNIWLLEGYHPTGTSPPPLHRKGIVTETAERWIETLINRLEKTDPLIKPDKQILITWTRCLRRARFCGRRISSHKPSFSDRRGLENYEGITNEKLTSDKLVNEHFKIANLR